jgi:Domain of unknown function (DUF4129)
LAAQPAVFASGSPPTAAALRDAQAQLLRDPTLQFQFNVAEAAKPTRLPDWLKGLGDVLGAIFKVIGPILGWIFIGGLVAALAVVLFFIGREIVRANWPGLFKRKPKPEKPADWRPDAAVARALLEDADKLAAAGRYAEAVRLLLHRSIEEIDGRRPRLVKPALTSREIGRLTDIPEAARTTFVAIAGVVEHSFFGGRPIDADGFTTCRRAYEAFAFPGAWA